MTALLRAWAADPRVGAVLLDGAGERAFCAGGDIRALYDAAKSGGTTAAAILGGGILSRCADHAVSEALLALMDGLSWAAASASRRTAAHRVVTERSAVAMPEVGIGFFPDIGATYWLARTPGFAGTYMALTGNRMNAADAIFCKLADVHIASVGLPNCRRRWPRAVRPMMSAPSSARSRARRQPGSGSGPIVDRRLLRPRRCGGHRRPPRRREG